MVFVWILGRVIPAGSRPGREYSGVAARGRGLKRTGGLGTIAPERDAVSC